jgi:hypothetical protein
LDVDAVDKKDMTQIMRRLHLACQQLTNRRRTNYLAGTLLLCLLGLFLVACDANTSKQNSNQHQSVQTDSGTTITYSTRSQDVLIRLFYGGGKVGTLEFTPEISVYGDGTFIAGPGMQLKQGSLSTNQLQSLLHTLTSTDNLLQFQRQTFDDIPDQNATLLQMALNGKNYQFIYGPFGNLQESAKDVHAYQQLGNAISTIRNALVGPLTTYNSTQKALLVYQTFRADFTQTQNLALPDWPLTDIDPANTAIYECGIIPLDLTGPNADNGCLVYTIPHIALLLSQNDLQILKSVLPASQQQMFLSNGDYFVALLRPLLPDEIAQKQLAMYGSDNQTYTPVPLKGGPVPIPTITTTPEG